MVLQEQTQLLARKLSLILSTLANALLVICVHPGMVCLFCQRFELPAAVSGTSTGRGRPRGPGNHARGGGSSRGRVACPRAYLPLQVAPLERGGHRSPD